MILRIRFVIAVLLWTLVFVGGWYALHKLAPGGECSDYVQGPHSCYYQPAYHDHD